MSALPKPVEAPPVRILFRQPMDGRRKVLCACCTRSVPPYNEQCEKCQQLRAMGAGRRI